MLAYIFLLTLATVTLAFFNRSFGKHEFRIVWFSFLLHSVSAVGQVVYTLYIYRGGDMLLYHDLGAVVAQQIRDDFRYLPDLLSLALQQPGHRFFWVIGAGSSTGTMVALSGSMEFLVGHSLVAKCLIFALTAFVGKLIFYRGFKQFLPTHLQTRALIAIMMLPSAVFWSSGIVKESVTITGLGFFFFGFLFLLRRRSLSFVPVLSLVVGTFLISLTKTYVFVVLAISCGLWIGMDRLRKKNKRFVLKFKHILLLTITAVGIFALIQKVYPEYSLEEVSRETATLQNSYRQLGGGSNVTLTKVEETQGIRGQVINMPVAFISTLFRPFIFEVRNVAMLINAFETTAILSIILWLLYTMGPRTIWKRIRGEPLLLFALVYTLIFAIALGLAAPNLGTLSRYRTPMLPIFWLLLLLLVPAKTTPQLNREKISRYFGKTA